MQLLSLFHVFAASASVYLFYMLTIFFQISSAFQRLFSSHTSLTPFLNTLSLCSQSVSQPVSVPALLVTHRGFLMRKVLGYFRLVFVRHEQLIYPAATPKPLFHNVTRKQSLSHSVALNSLYSFISINWNGEVTIDLRFDFRFLAKLHALRLSLWLLATVFLTARRGCEKDFGFVQSYSRSHAIDRRIQFANTLHFTLRRHIIISWLRFTCHAAVTAILAERTSYYLHWHKKESQ